MQMRTGNFLTIWVAVWRSVDVKSVKDNHHVSAILKCGLGQFDLVTGHVEKKVFALVELDQRNDDTVRLAGESPLGPINGLLLHCHQFVGFDLCDVYVGHAQRIST